MTTKKNNINNTTLAKLLVALNSSLDKADAQLAGGPSLTPDQKRRAARARKGSERIVQSLAQLASSHGLDSSALNSSDMLERLDTATKLMPTVTRLTKVLKQTSDAQFVAQNDAWAMARQFYALLQTRASSDGTLAVALAPVTDFFNYRHESAVEDKPTKLQTRVNAKLRDAERLVARSKPRASVIEEQNEARASTSVPTPAPAPQPQPVIIVQQPAPAPAPTPVAQPVIPPSVTIVPSMPSISNGVTNGASNGYVNGASNGASNGAASQ